jgi:hypothetical protein
MLSFFTRKKVGTVLGFVLELPLFVVLLWLLYSV